MLRLIQKLTVAVVLRVVHAALIELMQLDSRAKQEFERLPEEMSYAIATGYGAPTLFVRWRGGKLERLASLDSAVCTLAVKSLPLSFQLFTGQMGLAQAYARHAFTLKGDVADVMKLARLVNLTEAYLFPPFITRHILTDIPRLEVNPLRVYGRIACGFLCNRYKLTR